MDTFSAAPESVDPPYEAEDPRTHVTPHAFRLDPSLLGSPLAGPWRRGLAILIDWIAVVILANASGILLGIAAAFVVTRAAIKPAAGGVIRKSAKFVTRTITAVLIFALFMSIWGLITDDDDDDDDDENSFVVNINGGDPEEVAEVRNQMRGLQGMDAASGVLTLMASDDDEEARRRANRVLDSLRRANIPDREIVDILTGLEDTSSRPWVDAALRAEINRIEQAMTPDMDSLAAATDADQLLGDYAAARTAGDSAEIARIRPLLPGILSRDTIQAMAAVAAAETDRASELAEELEEEQGRRRGIISAFRSVSDDLGMGLGWSGLYFTFFTVIWRGQTPAKRLLGLRVVRLDGQPISWFGAFERFAGYAAGLATGLLGFLQIFWDRNRQGIQDKISGTVVLRDR